MSITKSEQVEKGINEKTVDSSIPVPLHTKLLSHQIGGHAHEKTKFGLLKHENGDILKPICPSVKKNIRELRFYESVSGENVQDPLMLQLLSFLPLFKGTWVGRLNGAEITYLCLEDVTSKFKRPCSMDIKIGARTYDPEATEEKKQYEENKCAAASVIGYRIVGMKVFSESMGKYFVMDKYFGRMQTPETILDALHMFFNKDCQCYVSAVLSAFIHRLRAIEEWFIMQRKFAFYASSILFVYESDSSSWLTWLQGLNSLTHIQLHGGVADCKVRGETFKDQMLYSTEHFNDANNAVPSMSRVLSTQTASSVCLICGLPKEICDEITANFQLFNVHMIDFAHVFPSDIEDSNYIFGLQNLIEDLKTLLQKVFFKNT